MRRTKRLASAHHKGRRVSRRDCKFTQSPTSMSVPNELTKEEDEDDDDDMSFVPSTLEKEQVLPAPPADGRCLVNRLPPELLSYVFVLRAKEDDGEADVKDDAAYVTFYREPKWRYFVTQICRSWRGVAINTAALWTYIRFDDKQPYLRQLTYLQRSQAALLDIIIAFSNSARGLQDVFELIMPHAARWRTLKVEVALVPQMKYVLQQICNCPAAPALRSLDLIHKIKFNDETRDTAAYKIIAARQAGLPWFGGNAPALKKLKLLGVPFTANTPLPSTLTTLELVEQSWALRPLYADFSRMLSGLSQLETLRLTKAGPRDDPPFWSEQPVQLRSLKNLHIKWADPSDIQALLERMIMDQLLELELDFYVENCDDLLQSLTRAHPFMHHSVFSKLETLIVGGLRCSPNTVGEAYESLVKLKKLRLNFSFLSYAWYKALRRQPLLCRELVSFSARALPGENLRRLVQFRERAGVPLKQLRVAPIEHELTLCRKDEEWLRKNVEDFKYYEATDTDDSGCSCDRSFEDSSDSYSDGSGFEGD